LWLLQAFKGIYVFGDRITENLQVVGCFLITLLTVPVVGLYYSLRCRVFFVALFWTAATAIALPWLAALGVWTFMPVDPSSGEVPLYWEIVLGVAAGAGALALLRWRGAGSPGVSAALGTALAILGIFSLVNGSLIQSWRIGGPATAGLLSASDVQIGIAAWLGARLRRRLETRQFALPR
jgi:hypothetical protein